MAATLKHVEFQQLPQCNISRGTHGNPPHVAAAQAHLSGSDNVQNERSSKMFIAEQNE